MDEEELTAKLQKIVSSAPPVNDSNRVFCIGLNDCRDIARAILSAEGK